LHNQKLRTKMWFFPVCIQSARLLTARSYSTVCSCTQCY